MKTYKIFFALFILFFLMAPFVIAQDLNVHLMIGEKLSAVTKKYGKPVHQDNSSPEMMCMFYQTKTNRMIFVANSEGVYQSEANATYDSENSARTSIEALITGSLSKGFEVDTVSVSDFHLHKQGIKVDLRLTENKLSKKFEVSVKANKSEE